MPSTYTRGGRVTFIWSGANGDGKGTHDLYLNRRKILTFTNQAFDYTWKNGNYELFFDFKNRNAENSGVYYLTVPSSILSAENKATIRVQSVKSEGGYDWFMIHNFTDTIEYEKTSKRYDELNYNHIGRANEIITGNCSDGIQNGDETGIDCGGSCITDVNEICNCIDDNKDCLIDEEVRFFYGHYYVIANLCFEQNARNYVKDVNDIGYPVLADVLGFTPETNIYIADFTLKDFLGDFYLGLGMIDGVTGGYIVLWDEPIRNPTTFPRNICYDLFYETIHGFTEPLKYNIHTLETRHRVMGRGEDFDIIFEVEALERLGATVCLDELYAVFYSNESFPHFPVYYDIREKYGWEPIKKFLKTLNDIKDQTHVNTDDQECFYLSISVGEDVSAIYEAHNKTISQETKNKIRNYFGF